MRFLDSIKLMSEILLELTEQFVEHDAKCEKLPNLIGKSQVLCSDSEDCLETTV